MKHEKQLAFLRCLATGKYRANPETGQLESYRKAADQWQPLKGGTLPSGYAQYVLWAGRCTGERVIVYQHIAIWIACNGTYDEGLEVDHIDRDNTNNKLSNLRLATPAQNIDNREQKSRKAINGMRLIREQEIIDILRLHKQGYNQSQIARTLDLNRLSVRYTLKRAGAGQPLKYENWNKAA